MSGEETLAQVNRELEYPKHKNLMRAGFVIFVYSLLFTSLVSFFAYAIIPDNVTLQEKSLFTNYEQELFSNIVKLAEKIGKHAELIVVPSSNTFQAIAHTAVQLDSSEIIAGGPTALFTETIAKQVGKIWEKLTGKRTCSLRFRFINANGKIRELSAT